MPINMQGPWTVSVTAKHAVYDQRFIITYDDNSDIYPGDLNTSVPVSADNWTITIQNNPGSGWVESDTQIKFPAVVNGEYCFNIESNDAWVGDADFNDLILTCSTPQTQTDFLLYGNVSYYEGLCLFNPCSQWPYAIIDSIKTLENAVTNSHLHELIKIFYKERIPVEAIKIGPWPDPPPIRPMVIPLKDGYAIPPKRAQILKLGEPLRQPAKSKKKIDLMKEESARPVTSIRSVRLASPQPIAWGIDSPKMGRIYDAVKWYCKTGKLPGVVLKFQEYDRTAAELSGNPYAGDGDREDLGVCATDRNGNYIFRFTRSISEYISEYISEHIGEGLEDVPLGEDEVLQAQPDIIVQVLDPMSTTGVSYEGAPVWDVSLMQNIDLCVPNIKPTACQGGNAIQAIGNIFIGDHVGDTRVGYNNYLNEDGRITAHSTIGNTPPARCAAWRGNLDLFACFLDLPVKYYTIRYRTDLSQVWADTAFFTQKYTHPQIAHIADPGYSGTPVGPDPAVTLTIDGSNLVGYAYHNIEKDTAWVSTNNNRKAIISSWLYAPTQGLVEFLIEGYDSGGNKVSGAEDTIRLFIDNSLPDYRIFDVTMSETPGGDCALYTLPPDNPGEPLTVEFKANQMQGQMNAYQLAVRKGNIGVIGIGGLGPEPISGAYVHGDDLACTLFRGTIDYDPANNGIIVADIVPTSGHWLEPDQPYCTFAVQLSCSIRATNGYNIAVYGYGPTQYLLGIQQPI